MANKFMFVCVGMLALGIHTVPLPTVAQTTGCVLLMDGQFQNPQEEWYAALVLDNGVFSVAVHYRHDGCLGPSDLCSWSVSLPVPREGEDWSIVGLSQLSERTYLFYSDGKVYMASGEYGCIGGGEPTVCTPPSGWDFVFDLGYTGACQTGGWPIRGGSTAAVAGGRGQSDLPGDQLVSQPNPFSISTMVRFSLGAQEHVNVDIYNAAGQRIRSLLDAHLLPGDHSLFWDGRDENGKQVASGAYLARVTTGKGAHTEKMIKVQ